MISLRTALILYAVLLGFAFATLKGTALALAVIIVLGLAIKSYMYYLRNRIH
jgi:uncharacterized membrane protein